VIFSKKEIVLIVTDLVKLVALLMIVLVLIVKYHILIVGYVLDREKYPIGRKNNSLKISSVVF